MGIKKYSCVFVAAKLLQEQGTWMEPKWGNVTSNEPVVDIATEGISKRENRKVLILSWRFPQYEQQGKVADYIWND